MGSFGDSRASPSTCFYVSKSSYQVDLQLRRMQMGSFGDSQTSPSTCFYVSKSSYQVDLLIRSAAGRY
jgi:hypothetical protein